MAVPDPRPRRAPSGPRSAVAVRRRLRPSGASRLAVPVPLRLEVREEIVGVHDNGRSITELGSTARSLLGEHREGPGQGECREWASRKGKEGSRPPLVPHEGTPLGRASGAARFVIRPSRYPPPAALMPVRAGADPTLRSWTRGPRADSERGDGPRARREQTLLNASIRPWGRRDQVCPPSPRGSRRYELRLGSCPPRRYGLLPYLRSDPPAPPPSSTPDLGRSGSPLRNVRGKPAWRDPHPRR